jgi:hypothetical protein
MAMIETPEAVENAGAIAAVDGIDALHIGASDLSTEMGIPGQYTHERMRAAFETVARAAKGLLTSVQAGSKSRCGIGAEGRSCSPKLTFQTASTIDRVGWIGVLRPGASEWRHSADSGRSQEMRSERLRQGPGRTTIRHAFYSAFLLLCKNRSKPAPDFGRKRQVISAESGT